MDKMRTVFITSILLLMAGFINGQNGKSVYEAQGLEVGTSAPMFTALDADSLRFSLKEALETSPVILIFYRGFWCPVCNKHLGSIQDSLKMIEEKGAKVIAISPEKPEYLDKMAKKTGAEFTLLYDEDYQIAEAYDVDFMPTGKQLFTYNVLLHGKLKNSHSDDSQRLPVPATYILNRKGIITWRQFDPNYKNRSSVKDILEAIDEMYHAE